MKLWMDKVKEYFNENAAIFAGGLSVMNGSSGGYMLYQNRK